VAAYTRSQDARNLRSARTAPRRACQGDNLEHYAAAKSTAAVGATVKIAGRILDQAAGRIGPVGSAGEGVQHRLLAVVSNLKTIPWPKAPP